MKHLVAGLVALVMFGAAGAVIWFSRTALGVPELAFAGGFVLMGAGLLAPMDLQAALGPLAAVVGLVRGKKADG